ncbi:MAG TPA: ankyrin repeat domain-containing protein [Gemmatimonadaceae bacterium]|jgi:ankyrin repeat protein
MQRINLLASATLLLVATSAAGAQDYRAKTSLKLPAREPVIAEAAQRGDAAAAKSAMAKGADVNLAEGDGSTALHWAAQRGDVALVKSLLAAHANVKATTRIGSYTPLDLAAQSGNAEIINLLIKAGADVKAKTSTGASAIHFAAQSGNPEAVVALLDHGADPNVRDGKQGQTPLVFAAENNRAAAIRVLLKHGADPSVHTTVIKTAEEQALEQAITKRRNEVLVSFEPEKHKDDAKKAAADSVAAAAAAAANPAAAARGGGGGRGGRGGPQPKGPFTSEQIQTAIDSGRAFGERMKDSVAKAADAAKDGDIVKQDTTSANGFNRGAKMIGTGGLSALHHAVRQGNIDAVTALLDGGANVNDTSGVDHMTPLLTAAINGQFDVAMVLIAHHADPNIASGDDMTPLYATLNTQWMPRVRYPQPEAIQVQKTSYLAVMEALLKAGANPNVRLKTQPWYYLGLSSCGNSNCGAEDITGSNAFWRAAYGLDVDAMKLLVKYGADYTVPAEKLAVAGAGGAAGGRGGRGGAAGGAAGGRGGRGGGAGAAAGDPAAGGAAAAGAGRGFARPAGAENLPGIDSIAKATPAGAGVYPIDAVAGVGYGTGYAGGSHRHAPDAWMPALRYMVEVLHADVNQRDNLGLTPLHNAAARGDNEMIMYLVQHGADIHAVSKKGQTVVDMANGPQSRVTPIPDTIALLEKLGAVNQHHCQSC